MQLQRFRRILPGRLMATSAFNIYFTFHDYNLEIIFFELRSACAMEPSERPLLASGAGPNEGVCARKSTYSLNGWNQWGRATTSYAVWPSIYTKLYNKYKWKYSRKSFDVLLHL